MKLMFNANKISSIVLATLLVGILGTIGQSAHADTITLNSGNGVLGGTDSVITMHVGLASPTGPWGSPLTTEFASAVGGPNAYIVTPHPAWKDPLDGNPGSKWICGDPNCNNTDAAGPSPTTLFAHPFTICDDDVASAELTIRFLVDNDLGDTDNEGVFINGMSVGGTSLIGGGFAHFQGDTQRGPFDITNLVQPGVTNHLFVNQVDRTQVASGVQYSATIDYQCSLPIGGTVGSMDTASLLVAGTQANMSYWWIVALVGGVAGVGIVVKAKTNKPNKETL